MFHLCGGFDHFTCEECNAYSIIPNDPLLLTFVPNHDGYENPPVVTVFDTLNGHWKSDSEDGSYASPKGRRCAQSTDFVIGRLCGFLFLQ